jgi:uncharacterized LabA/DUF88 family protein
MDTRIGVYVDAANVMLNGGRDLRYDVLRDHVARGGGRIQRLNTYLPVDYQRRLQDAEYRNRQDSFLRRIRDMGWRVHQKRVKRFTQDDGEVVLKANADMELAIDVIEESDRLDLVVLLSGDGDFCRLVQALQHRGCRVEVIGFRNVARDLRAIADFYCSGFLLPGLVPGVEGRRTWAGSGTWVRGVLDHWNQDKQVGVIRFLDRIDDRLWDVDHRRPNSPWQRAFVHASAFYEDEDPAQAYSEERVIEFRLEPNAKEDPRWMAMDCELVDKE